LNSALHLFTGAVAPATMAKHPERNAGRSHVLAEKLLGVPTADTGTGGLSVSECVHSLRKSHSLFLLDSMRLLHLCFQSSLKNGYMTGIALTHSPNFVQLSPSRRFFLIFVEETHLCKIFCQVMDLISLIFPQCSAAFLRKSLYLTILVHHDA